MMTFSAIVRTGSFIQAARTLGFAQPTVTMHIQTLENELGVKLFERLGRRVTMTQEGECLLTYAEQIVKLSVDARTALESRSAKLGRLVIGANESFSLSRLPAILQGFRKAYPGIDISLRFGTVRAIHELIQSNEADVAFFLTREIGFPDLNVETLFSEPVVAVAAPDHPFGAFSQVTITDFANQDLIITQESCTYRAMIDGLLRETNTNLRSLTEVNNVQVIKQLVMSGLGVSILPLVAVGSEIAQGTLVEIPWAGPELPVFTQIAYHKDKWISPTLRSFLEHARS